VCCRFTSLIHDVFRYSQADLVGAYAAISV